MCHRSGSVETYPFQAEVSRLMDILINSLYSNKDIFLRELISNAGDVRLHRPPNRRPLTPPARRWTRFASSPSPSRRCWARETMRSWTSGCASFRHLFPHALLTPAQMSLDKENNILTLRDRGIGMTKQQLKENLGTIAKSGTSGALPLGCSSSAWSLTALAQPSWRACRRVAT